MKSYKILLTICVIHFLNGIFIPSSRNVADLIEALEQDYSWWIICYAYINLVTKVGIWITDAILVIMYSKIDDVMKGKYDV